MFCFILFSFSSSLNQIDSIKNLLNQESYQLAYQSANEAILKEGVRKADDILFLLRGMQVQIFHIFYQNEIKIT